MEHLNEDLDLELKELVKFCFEHGVDPADAIEKIKARIALVERRKRARGPVQSVDLH